MSKVMKPSRPRFPRLAFWYVTEKCDYPPSGGKGLNTREAKSFICDLTDAGVKALTFTGGKVGGFGS